jgi:hypothetical protein
LTDADSVTFVPGAKDCSLTESAVIFSDGPVASGVWWPLVLPW